ncbi:NAD-dependent epimerase/dehydratase family protein [Planobispora longispora]|uniref:UDP-glucose 4-epimerase n=1 Tax=Planobispora longispora TaxID=28887 RepID=A0A8J3W5U5_9ACTN|nr:NAD-dependent epimerase/dehydratase family protein [Planobispora longispora]BFE85758.1 UDP-glucose 4-epimerase [Planobispora longispora]GIH76201.1 UDP-glucose 4-epimerase [Planobispora longispora]
MEDTVPSAAGFEEQRRSRWAGSRALVTGAAGFIGSHLARRLSELGAEVHAVSRRPRAAGHGETWHRADLRDTDATAKLFGSVRPDVVIHLASEVNGARHRDVVLPTLESNLASTVNVLSAAADRPDTTVLLTGSAEEPRPGNGQAFPPSPYAMAKWAASGYAQLFHRLWNVPCTILRPTMVYGPGQRDTAKLVPYVTLSLLRGEEPSLTSGAKLADWIYVDDVVDAFVAAYDRGEAVGEGFDVGTGTSVSVREVVELLSRIIGGPARPRFGEVSDRPLDIPQTADPGPAAAVLGWRSTVELEEGLKRTVAWYADGHTDDG